MNSIIEQAELLRQECLRNKVKPLYVDGSYYVLVDLFGYDPNDLESLGDGWYRFYNKEY